MRFAPGLIAVVVAATGCEASTSAPAPERVITTSGSLTVDWTVNGTTDPNACQRAGAVAIEIALVTNTNQPVGSFQQSCSAFNTSVALEQGIYAGQVRLIDAAGLPRTKTLAIDEVTINGSSQLTVALDFAPPTFL